MKIYVSINLKFAINLYLIHKQKINSEFLQYYPLFLHHKDFQVKL